jgi:hypothetical protein
MANFAPIRDIPQDNLSEWEWAVLSAMKENIEVLAGSRQTGVRAVTTDNVSTSTIDSVSYQQMLAEGKGSSFSGSPTYADFTDYTKLIQSVINLAYDVEQIRNTLNALVTQLKT